MITSIIFLNIISYDFCLTDSEEPFFALVRLCRFPDYNDIAPLGIRRTHESMDIYGRSEVRVTGLA